LGPTAISKQVPVSKSTISRELKRNSTPKGYAAESAHKKALKRCKRKPYKANGERLQAVIDRLNQQHSPEQIARRLKKENHPGLSHEAIYQLIYADKQRGGTLYQHLRQSRKKRRKRRDGPRRRGQIPHRVGIEHRPAEVEDRAEPGHWEADTVVGAEREGAILTLVERQSRLLTMAYLPVATAQAVEEATVALLKDHLAGVKTITFDNGKEFTNHHKIAQQLDCQTYFAHPYSPWERGTNENTNGLLRQYIPKKVPLLVVTPQRLIDIQNTLNHRPRKTLDFLSPLEFLDQKLKNSAVAFET
jgi:IS30 family transposase